MWSRIVIGLVLLNFSSECLGLRTQMCTVLKRSQMTYVLTDSERQQLVNNGYNFSADPFNGIFTMVVNPNNGEIYITAHRLFSPIGMVPYSLGVQRSYEFNAPVYPFPSFEENQNAPYGIYSAVSTTQDKCGNLWIVDQGIKTITDPQPVYPPGLFAYNFAARKITYRYRFPQEFFTDRGTTTTRLIVDSYYGCDKMKLIVADTLNYCLLVHDMETGSSWKVCHPTMNYDPKYADFKYENYTLSNLPTGVYSLAITPPLGKSRTRYLMYSSYSGITLYSVPLSIVFNKKLWTRGYSIWKANNQFIFKNKDKYFKKYFDKEEDETPTFKYIDVNRYFRTVGSDPNHQAQYCDTDLERGILFCALPSIGAISAWKFKEPYENRRLVVQNREELQNAAILRVLQNRKGKNELVLSKTPITPIFLGVLKPNPNNYGVYTCQVSDILKGDNVRCTSGIFNHCQ